MAEPAKSYANTVRELSDRIVTAQRPIRILDAIKWDEAVMDAFMARRARELPQVDRAYYESRPLGFDPESLRAEFQDIERQTSRRLGQFNPLAGMMRRICREYVLVIRMLEARGRPEFSQLSQELYGAAGDVFHAGDPSLAELGSMMAGALANIERSALLPEDARTISGEEAAKILQSRLDAAFSDTSHQVRVTLSDGIVADAAAGANYLKIRKDARFSRRDLRLLEVHEGWVHLGTTYNGLQQPYCTFLSKGPPSATVTQEGLAILMELISLRSHPGRVRRLTNRIRAVDMCENGADFLQVFRFFRDQGIEVEESYHYAVRVFRGSTPDGGPFTKDICYSKGFVLVYNYVQLAVHAGLLDRLPLLFCGKTTLEDLRTLAQGVEEGIVSPPGWLPPQFADLQALAAWMCYSSFLSSLSLKRIESDFAGIL